MITNRTCSACRSARVEERSHPGSTILWLVCLECGEISCDPDGRRFPSSPPSHRPMGAHRIGDTKRHDDVRQVFGRGHAARKASNEALLRAHAVLARATAVLNGIRWDRSQAIFTLLHPSVTTAGQVVRHRLQHETNAVRGGAGPSDPR